MRNCPVLSNFLTRLFPWSATQTFPLASTSIPLGLLRSLPAVPSFPNDRRSARLELHCSMRLLPVSATQIEPSGPIAMAAGSFISPPLVPLPSRRLIGLPVGPNFWIRLLPVSATQMLPPEVRAIPFGAFSCPARLPPAAAWQTLPEAAVQRFFSAWVPAASTFVLLTLVPKVRTNSPFSLNPTTRLLPVSAAQ